VEVVRQKKKVEYVVKGGKRVLYRGTDVHAACTVFLEAAKDPTWFKARIQLLLNGQELAVFLKRYHS
jgi:hypothetical protein